MKSLNTYIQTKKQLNFLVVWVTFLCLKINNECEYTYNTFKRFQ